MHLVEMNDHARSQFVPSAGTPQFPPDKDDPTPPMPGNEPEPDHPEPGPMQPGEPAIPGQLPQVPGVVI